MCSNENKTIRPYPEAMLDPKLDPIFKSLFTQNTEDSQKALTAFLSVILSLQRTKNLLKMQVLSNEQISQAIGLPLEEVQKLAEDF